MYRAIGICESAFTQQNIGPLCRGKECWIASPYSHYDETITRVVISGAAFEDERALTAKRGLEHGLKESSLDRFEALWKVLSSHLPEESYGESCVVALAEDVPLQSCPIDARGVDVFATAAVGGSAREWRCRWELPVAHLEDLRRAIASGAQCLVVMSHLPLAAAQDSDADRIEDSANEDRGDSVDVSTGTRCSRRWQLSNMSPLVTSGGQQTVSILRALKFGWTERTRLPPLFDMGDEPSSSWLNPELAAAAHRLVGFHRFGPRSGSYIADAIWDVLHHASAVVLFHRDKHGHSFGIYHNTLDGPSAFTAGFEQVLADEIVIPFAIPPIVARWDRAIKDLRVAWRAEGREGFPIAIYEPPPPEEDSDFDSESDEGPQFEEVVMNKVTGSKQDSESTVSEAFETETKTETEMLASGDDAQLQESFPSKDSGE